MNKKILSNTFLLFLMAMGLFLNSCTRYNGELDDLEMPPETNTNAILSNQIIEGIEVSSEQAATVATTFFAKSTKANQKDIVVKSIEVINDDKDVLALYVVNIEPSGFVLVSSHTKDIPVVAFSKEGYFELTETSPDGLKSWLAESMLLNNKLEGKDIFNEEIARQWHELSLLESPYPAKNAKAINTFYGPLLSTRWGQGNPYNYYAPNHYPVGCVAVATGQVMRYHRWPNSFNWNIMPNRATTTNSGGLEVARLLRNIGVNVNMNYTASGSGAYNSDARDALVNDYGYSSHAYYGSYSLSKIKTEIMSRRPVVMDGYHTKYTTGWWIWKKNHYRDGHSWVCDGYTLYRGNDWLHMNWGWSGYGNGWFRDNNLVVSGVNITVNGNATNPNFRYNKHCIYRIHR